MSRGPIPNSFQRWDLANSQCLYASLRVTQVGAIRASMIELLYHGWVVSSTGMSLLFV
jgi:hypothetical protein